MLRQGPAAGVALDQYRPRRSRTALSPLKGFKLLRRLTGPKQFVDGGVNILA
jgi:hypothetical protein